MRALRDCTVGTPVVCTRVRLPETGAHDVRRTGDDGHDGTRYASSRQDDRRIGADGDGQVPGPA